jgi:hypothetical protein
MLQRTQPKPTHQPTRTPRSQRIESKSVGPDNDAAFIAACAASNISAQSELAVTTARNESYNLAVTESTNAANTLEHFTKEQRCAGAMSRVRFDDLVAKSSLAIKRIQMPDDGMCAIRSLITALNLSISCDGQLKDLLDNLKSTLLQLSSEQKEYVHQVNEMWDPDTVFAPFTGQGDTRHVPYNDVEFTKHVNSMGSWIESTKKYDTNLEAGFLMCLARTHGVLNTQMYLQGSGDSFRIHTYGGEHLHIKSTITTQNLDVAYIAVGRGHFDLILQTESPLQAGSLLQTEIQNPVADPVADHTTHTVGLSVDSGSYQSHSVPEPPAPPTLPPTSVPLPATPVLLRVQKYYS